MSNAFNINFLLSMFLLQVLTLLPKGNHQEVVVVPDFHPLAVAILPPTLAVALLLSSHPPSEVGGVAMDSLPPHDLCAKFVTKQVILPWIAINGSTPVFNVTLLPTRTLLWLLLKLWLIRPAGTLTPAPLTTLPLTWLIST